MVSSNNNILPENLLSSLLVAAQHSTGIDQL